MAAYSSASDESFLELATADNGNEPIIARQYTGITAFTTLSHEAYILDKNGDSKFNRIYEGGKLLSDKYQAKGSYAAANHSHGYLPLAGGTMTSDIAFSTLGKGIQFNGNTDFIKMYLKGTNDSDTKFYIDSGDDSSVSTIFRFKGIFNDENSWREVVTIDKYGITINNDYNYRINGINGKIVATQSGTPGATNMLWAW